MERHIAELSGELMQQDFVVIENNEDEERLDALIEKHFTAYRDELIEQLKGQGRPHTQPKEKA